MSGFDDATSFVPHLDARQRAMLAFAMGLDTLYVGAHHLVRFVAIGLAMPLVLSRVKNAPPR